MFTLCVWWSWCDVLGDWLYELMEVLSYVSPQGYAAMNRGFDDSEAAYWAALDDAADVAAAVDAVWASVARLSDL